MYFHGHLSIGFYYHVDPKIRLVRIAFEKILSGTSILSRSFVEFNNGSGNVVYSNDFQISAGFSVRMLQNGCVKGELRFDGGLHIHDDNYYSRLLECLNQRISFRLNGSTSQGMGIAIEECSTVGYSEIHSEASEPRHQIECNFKAKKGKY
jgi:hypothetical protein